MPRTTKSAPITHWYELSKKYLSLTLGLVDTLSAEIQGFKRFHHVSTNCQEIYKKYHPLAMDLIATISTKYHECYEKCQPLDIDLFKTIWAKIYVKIASFANESSVFNALFGYVFDNGRVQIMAVPSGSTCKHSISSTKIAAAPLFGFHQTCLALAKHMWMKLSKFDLASMTPRLRPLLL